MSPEAANVLTAGIAAVAAVSSAVIGLFAARNHRETRQELRHNTAKTDLVLDQVGNDHQSNLRDDLDQVQADVAGYGALLERLLHKIEGALAHDREHEAGAALALDGLMAHNERTDRRLAALEAREEPQRHD